MSAPSSGLNPAQEQAVRVDGHCLITAPPGSGKTTVLKERAGHLLRSDPGGRLVGVTFTADAAGELEERIRKLLPGVGKRLVCGTFHSLCKRQLESAGLKFLLVNEMQQADLMRRAFLDIIGRRGAADVDLSYETASAFIEATKSKAEPMFGRTDLDEMLREIYERYNGLLEQMGAMDFADLLVKTVRGMGNPQSGIRPWDARWMLVDEFQDGDEIQYAWIRAHIRRGMQVTCVGDDDQSIYSWRSGMGYRGLELFRRDSNATHVCLNVTYRCAREIISPAAQLIGHNTERVEKIIQTANKRPGEVIVQPCADGDSEIVAVLSAILASGVSQYGKWGVLARNNILVDAIERALLANNIPYVRSGGASFWDSPGPALLLGVCHSLVSGAMVGVDELMRKCGVNEDRLQRVHKQYDSRKAGGLQRFLSDRSGAARQNDTVEVVRARMGEWKDLMQEGNEDAALNGIGTFIKSRATLFDGEGSPKLVAKDKQKIDLCVKSLKTLHGGLMSRMHYLRNADSKPKKADAVRIMTLHSSKGLEFPNVWMMGCQQGTIPSDKSGDLDEERRLFYVGMTRAIDRLYLSYSLKGQRSIFVEEAGF